MVDVTMCESKNCPVARNCYRHPLSGTIGDAHRQAYFTEDPALVGDKCPFYAPVYGFLPTLRQTLREALVQLVARVTSPSRRGQGDFAMGYQSAWDFYSKALLKVIGRTLHPLETLEGELVMFLGTSTFEDVEDTIGTYDDGYRSALTAMVVGCISLLESFPDASEPFEWQAIAEGLREQPAPQGSLVKGSRAVN